MKVPGYQMSSVDITDAFGSTVTEQEIAEVTEKIRDAFDLASGQGKGTWIYDGGKRIAAILPVDAGEALQKYADRVVAEVNAALDQLPPARRHGVALRVPVTGDSRKHLEAHAMTEAVKFFDLSAELVIEPDYEVTPASGAAYQATIAVREVLDGD